MLIEKIEKIGYKIKRYREDTNTNFLSWVGIIDKEGTERFLSPHEKKPIYLNAVGCKNTDEAEKLVQAGVAIKFFSAELYKEIYGINDEELEAKKISCSVKTYRALKKLSEEVGFEEEFFVEGGNEELDREIRENSLPFYDQVTMNSGGITSNYKLTHISEYKPYKEKWIVSYSISDFESYGIGYMVFNKKPTQKNMALACRVQEVKDIFLSGRKIDDNGEWLDYSEDIIDCIIMLKKNII